MQCTVSKQCCTKLNKMQCTVSKQCCTKLNKMQSTAVKAVLHKMKENAEYSCQSQEQLTHRTSSLRGCSTEDEGGHAATDSREHPLRRLQCCACDGILPHNTQSRLLSGRNSQMHQNKRQQKKNKARHTNMSKHTNKTKKLNVLFS